MSTGANPTRPRVFISYSRKDQDFAEQLLAGIEVAGFDGSLDRHDIAAGEAWEARIGGLIDAADTVVFVISPDSVCSERCAWEVDRTIRQRKRLLPIVWRRVKEADVPLQLKQLNYIYFDQPSLLSAAALATLVTALQTDLDWIREHTRIGEAALRWEARKRPYALLFRGDELVAAKAWLVATPRFAPEPTLLQHAFIKASEEDDAARTSADRVRLDEMRAALAREQSANDERTAALQRERIALRRGKRALQASFGLLTAMFVGGVGWLNQEAIKELYHWRTVMVPSVLSASREAELAGKPGSEFRECAKLCPAMIVLPAGSFTMGSPPGEEGRDAGDLSDEVVQHEVVMPRPLAVSRLEISFAEWDACVDAGACEKAADRGWGRANRPVIFVSWSDAQDYTAWLSRNTGRKYRLLTEAEWEYAARGGTSTAYSFGNDAERAPEYGWYKGTTDRSQPVGSKEPNPFKLHDMHGNVWEWVQDCWNQSYATKSERLKETAGAWEEGDCSVRVVRGGSFNYVVASARSANRNRVSAGLRIQDLGFRVARDLTTR